jgi:hypothetical protein
VVLTPRRWCQALRKYPQSDGGKQARSPGRARRKPLKPLRREGRSVSAEPVCSCAFLLLHLARETAGAARTRSSLRPLVFRGQDEAQLGRNPRRENADTRQKNTRQKAQGRQSGACPTIVDGDRDGWWLERQSLPWLTFVATGSRSRAPLPTGRDRQKAARCGHTRPIFCPRSRLYLGGRKTMALKLRADCGQTRGQYPAPPPERLELKGLIFGEIDLAARPNPKAAEAGAK